MHEEPAVKLDADIQVPVNPPPNVNESEESPLGIPMPAPKTNAPPTPKIVAPVLLVRVQSRVIVFPSVTFRLVVFSVKVTLPAEAGCGTI